MTRSATDVMQDIVFAAAIDSIVALKAASKGLPNNLLRDAGAIHANTTFADLPRELQSAIQTSVRAAFARLLKEGYTVAPKGEAAALQRRPGPPREGAGERRPPGNRPPHGRGPGGNRPPGRGGRPPRKPPPR